MKDATDWAARGRDIIDADLYMVLGTADRGGSPWASPVYFAPLAYREFFWVSRPGARHSVNIGERPVISVVVFDSSVPISTGQAVCFSATAEEVGADRRAEVLEVFSRRTVSHGGRVFLGSGCRRARPAASLPSRGYRAIRHRRERDRVAVSL